MGQDKLDIANQTAQTEKTDERPVLVRKTQAGRVTHQARAMSVPKALRLTLAKVADDLLDMAMAVIGLRMEKCDHAALDTVFDAPGLLMMLDGPSRKRGAVAFDPVLVGGLIQQQTMGVVLPDAGGEQRSLTETDAAICAPFLDALLDRAAALPETNEERQLLEGFRFGTRADTARILLMGLEEPEYQVVRLTVDMAGGKRQGHIILCLPLPGSVADPAEPEEKGQAGVGDAERRVKKSLNDTVLGLHIDLNIALARLSMPLRAVGELKTGDILELGVTTFDQSRVLTMAGQGVGRGTLGQVNGVRAVRMDRQIDTSAPPKRRAGDRADLDQPDVAGDGTRTRRVAPVEAVHDQVALSVLPDIGLQETENLSQLTDLPDLPDMSDLPGFADDDEGHPESSGREAG